jgi:hypothetical protein
MTFSANAAGPTIRQWSKGANPKTSIQAATRANLSHLGSLWTALTPAAKLTWTSFGLAPPETDTNSLGEIIYLTGWQWFCRVNQRRQAAGLATTSTLPTSSAVAAPATCHITATALPAGSVSVSWTSGDFPAGYSASLFVASHPTAGLQNKTSGLLQLWIQHEPAGTSQNITAAVQARLGNVPATWKLFAQLYRVRDDGVRSTVTTATCIVT